MSPEPPPFAIIDERIAIGQAVKALRERAGLSQQEAGLKLGITRQAWQNYEAGARNSLLRTDLQDRLASAVGLTRADLLREVDRQRGIGPTGFSEEPARPYELEVLGRVRASPTGPQVYDLAEPESTVDVSWMFGPNVRTLRAAGDSMLGYVASGELVIYDTSQWPRRGEGCVVELHNGEVYVKEYMETGQGVLRVKQWFPEENISFPMSDVKGVYKVRLRGV